ncbi:LPS-assembly protein LptD [candidate division KSB1 bacterium]|nr:LPS-assembly protein LptD [candidate division KSB1 bacterium]
MIADSTVVDSLAPQAKKRSDLEEPIEYEAECIENRIKEKRTIMTGKAKVTYGDVMLTAEKITVDWNAREMRAEGLWDSVWVVSVSGDSSREVQLTGAPQFQEGSDAMSGEVMLFNFGTKKGRVLRGRMAYEDGFYGGQTFKMVKPKVFHVGDAAFTTCELEEDPHFHIWSKKMKIIADDKVVGKPIVMHIGKVPVLALPFLLFPIKRGRHSGFLIPKYGSSDLEGRYLRGLGYYWAASEYWDMESQLDFFEKSGVLVRGNLNYNARYKLRGRVSGSITRKNFEALGTKEQRWDLNIRHKQDITPFTDFSVDARFISSKDFYSDLSSNREHRMQKEIRSNAKLNHKWGRSGQVQLFLNQTRNLETDALSETLPKLTISNRIASLIPQPERSSRSNSEKWYHAFKVPYSFNIRGERNRQESGPDTNRTVEKDEGLGWNHSLSMYATPKLFGWLTLKPNVSYKETWVDRRKHYFVDSETNEIKDEEEHGFYALRTYNTSLSFNTKIYGMFHSRFLEGVLLRHVATPNVSFSYAPDFSKSQYGYYQTVTDTTGNAIEKDRYKGSLFRSTPSGEQQRMNMSLNNLFQMKIGEGEEVKKFDLFSYNLSTAYNWKATQYKLSDLRSRINASPTSKLSLSMNMNHSFYEVDDDGKKVDRLFTDNVDWSDLNTLKHLRLARMTSLDFNTTFRFKGKIRSGGDSSESSSEEDDEFDSEDLYDPDLESVGSMSGDRFEMDESVSAMEIPWSFNSTLSYNENRSNPHDITKRIWMQANMEFNLTRNWKISYKSRWDLKDKKAVSQDLVFYRDLHCWEAKFVWTPTGTYKRFYFKINVKSPMLQDLKFEKRSGRTGLYGN